MTRGASTTESYTYDAVGNRLSSLGVSPYQYNSSNELTSTPSGSYTYNANDNTLTDAQGRSFTWDFENRLAQVTVPQTGGGSNIVTFKYDPFGRRIQKVSPLGTKNYVYDGPNSITDIDSSGNALATYTQGLGLDMPLAQIRSSSVSYHQADGLFSITSLSSTSGTVVNSYTYDSFGNLVSSTSPGANSLRYTGREADSETGVYYYRARYYEPAIGRFIGEDPLRLHEGPNYYAYVNNGPTDFMDPSGLAKCCPSKFEKDIEAQANNARERLKHLREFGTAVLPTDTIANVGAMTGCIGGTVYVNGSNIPISGPSQYVMSIRPDPVKQPCRYECDLEHEKVHACQCANLGATKFNQLTECEAETPVYMVTLGCYLKMQYDNNLGPYHK